MVEVGTDLLGSESTPALLCKLGQLLQVVQNCVQSGCVFSTEETSQHPWATCSSAWSSSQWKSSFVCSISWVLVCDNYLLSCQWAPLRKSLAPSSSLPIRYLYLLIRWPQAFSFPNWSPSSLILFLHERCWSPLIIFESWALGSWWTTVTEM